jgi:hypothetical protein
MRCKSGLRGALTISDRFSFEQRAFTYPTASMAHFSSFHYSMPSTLAIARRLMTAALAFEQNPP